MPWGHLRKCKNRKSREKPFCPECVTALQPVTWLKVIISGGLSRSRLDFRAVQCVFLGIPRKTHCQHIRYRYYEQHDRLVQVSSRLNFSRIPTIVPLAGSYRGAKRRQANLMANPVSPCRSHAWKEDLAPLQQNHHARHDLAFHNKVLCLSREPHISSCLPGRPFSLLGRGKKC